MLKKSASDFDWVLVDAPSVGSLPDPGGLADLVRAVLLIIRSGCDASPGRRRAIAQLGRGSILGTVLNRREENTNRGGT